MSLEDWRGCSRCPLHKTRFKTVLGEGDIPAEFLFIGEAPGPTEDILGRPFVGPAGKILRTAIEDAVRLSGRRKEPTVYITNTVACIPKDKKDDKFREPTRLEVSACFPRVDETVDVVNPRTIILLGKIAKDHNLRHFPGAKCLVHPSFINYRGGTQAPEYRTFVRELVEIFRPGKAKLRRIEDG